MRIDVPREELPASWVFLKAKRKAGIRGMRMVVRRFGGTIAAEFSADAGWNEYRFLVPLRYEELRRSRHVVDAIAGQMARLYAEFLSKVDAIYLADWMRCR